jgi:hypothetical protein
MDAAVIDQTSEQFLGQWRRLVSTTNWDKGRIIGAWREVLAASDAPAVEYSDEAWSRRVGNVTPQHVGRLRRVYERFGAVQADYDGLFWSHFQAAIDWHDAEMWLEGAVQNDWSISQMRAQRNEAMGATGDADAATSDAELDSEPDDEGESEIAGTGTVEHVRAPGDASAERTADDTDDDDERTPFDDGDDEASSTQPATAANQQSLAEPVRPFANLPSLPADVSDAFESYKLCILRHKLSQWNEISRDDLIASLDALKELALAPAAD